MNASHPHRAAAFALLAVASWGAEARSGEEVYRQTCALCHEHVRVGPQLRDRQLPSAAVVQLVRSGFNGMPAFRATEISDAELQSLARYVNELKTPEKTQ